MTRNKAPMAGGVAVLEILRDVRKTRANSDASAKRIRRACDALGLSAEDRVLVFGYLEYCDTDGAPYGALARHW